MKAYNYRLPTEEEFHRTFEQMAPSGDPDADSLRQMMAFFELGRALAEDRDAPEVIYIAIGQKVMEDAL